MAYHRYHGIDPQKSSASTSTLTARGCGFATGRVVPAFIGQALSATLAHHFWRRPQNEFVLLRIGFDRQNFPTGHERCHEPVNIGNPREMTIKQFAEEIIRITGTKSQIENKPLPVDDPKVRQPDITRAKKVLG